MGQFCPSAVLGSCETPAVRVLKGQYYDIVVNTTPADAYIGAAWRPSLSRDLLSFVVCLFHRFRCDVSLKDYYIMASIKKRTFGDLTNAELRAKLKKRGARVGGNKDVLVQRYINFFGK